MIVDDVGKMIRGEPVGFHEHQIVEHVGRIFNRPSDQILEYDLLASWNF